MPHLKFHGAFMTHKPKETDADCADAWKVSSDNRRVAVSDGVTRSLYPGIFSKKLVYRFCRQSTDVLPDCEAWLVPVRERWREDAEERIDELRQMRNPAFINNNERLQTRVPGAATFVGVEFAPDQGEGGTAKITVIGDSCLFIFVDDLFSEAFPCASSAEFDNQPGAFLSYAAKNAAAPQLFERAMLPKGARSTHFVFATDALAKWIFEQHEKGENPLPTLLALKTESDFLDFVETARERNAHALNDDVTLVIMQVGETQIPKSNTPTSRIVHHKSKPGETQITGTVPPTCTVFSKSHKSESEKRTSLTGVCAAKPSRNQPVADTTAFDTTITALTFIFLCFCLFVRDFLDLKLAGMSPSSLDIFIVCLGAGFCGVSFMFLVCQAIALQKKNKGTAGRKGRN